MKDLIGEKFERLTVVKLYEGNDKKGVYWICKCDCGGEKIVLESNLTRGGTRSCGCLKRESKIPKPPIGEKREMLTVIDMVYKKKYKYYYKCICDCGNETLIPKYSFGITKSCGCLFYEYINTVHNDLSGKKFGRLTVRCIDESRRGNKKIHYLCDCECGNKDVSVEYSNLTSGTSKSCGCLSRELTSERMWKGGKTELTSFLREYLKKWKKESLAKYNYKCAISDSCENLVIHHIIPFKHIFLECMNELNMDIMTKIGDYSEEEICLIKDLFIEKHYEYGLGVVITYDIHKEFHSIYGVGVHNDYGLGEWNQFYNSKINNAC